MAIPGVPRSASEELVEQWIARFGELMAAPALAELFKFGSLRSFRRAAAAGSLPVPVFRVAGRRGWFARTRDAAAWLEAMGGSQREAPPHQTAQGKGGAR